MLVSRVTEQAKADFDRDGLVIVRGFFLDQEIRQLNENVHRYIEKVVPRIPAKDVFYQDKTKSADLNALLRLENMEQHDPYFAQLSVDMDPVAHRLLGEPASAQRVAMFDKAAGIGKPTPPHQDGYYFMLNPNVAVTFWLPLEAADELNGCVRYVRGSHRQGLRQHELSGVFGFSLGITDFGPQDEEEEVAAVVDPGDLVAHHSLTIHRAGPNTSGRSRRAMGLVFHAANSVVDRAAREAHEKNVYREWETGGKI